MIRQHMSVSLTRYLVLNITFPDLDNASLVYYEKSRNIWYSLTNLDKSSLEQKRISPYPKNLLLI